jgi:RNA polymerase sigma factor (TIGR02999 family)
MSSSKFSVDTTSLLTSHVSGDAQATSQLLPLVYDRLKKLAAHYMKAERPDHSLQPTALVHEAYLRLIDGARVDWNGRAHFFAVAARQMRRVLIDHARARNAQKRGAVFVSLVDAPAAGSDQIVEVLALERGLEKLGEASSRQVRVFELRFYSGLTFEEIGQHLRVSERTARDDWRVARIWLWRELYGSGSEAWS